MEVTEDGKKYVCTTQQPGLWNVECEDGEKSIIDLSDKPEVITIKIGGIQYLHKFGYAGSLFEWCGCNYVENPNMNHVSERAYASSPDGISVARIRHYDNGTMRLDFWKKARMPKEYSEIRKKSDGWIEFNSEEVLGMGGKKIPAWVPKEMPHPPAELFHLSNVADILKTNTEPFDMVDLPVTLLNQETHVVDEGMAFEVKMGCLGRFADVKYEVGAKLMGKPIEIDINGKHYEYLYIPFLNFFALCSDEMMIKAKGSVIRETYSYAEDGRLKKTTYNPHDMEIKVEYWSETKIPDAWGAENLGTHDSDWHVIPLKDMDTVEAEMYANNILELSIEDKAARMVGFAASDLRKNSYRQLVLGLKK